MGRDTVKVDAPDDSGLSGSGSGDKTVQTPTQNSDSWLTRLDPRKWSNTAKGVAAAAAIGALALSGWWFYPREQTTQPLPDGPDPEASTTPSFVPDVVSKHWGKAAGVLATGAAVAGAIHLTKKPKENSSGASSETESPPVQGQDKPGKTSEKVSSYQMYYLVIIALGVLGVPLAK